MIIQQSKSAKKREATALQEIGIELVKLKEEKLNELLPDGALKTTIIQAKSINSHGALRRQHQLIGKLMRAADFEDIITRFKEMQDEGNSKTANFHLIEKWRDRLINEGKEALTLFIAQYQPEDIQELKNLIKKSIDEEKKAQVTGAKKSLFRYIRDSL